MWLSGKSIDALKDKLSADTDAHCRNKWCWVQALVINLLGARAVQDD